MKYCVSTYPKSPNYSKVVLSLRLWSLYDYCMTVLTSIIVGTRRGAKRVMGNKNRFFIFQNSLKYPSWTRLIHFNTIKDCFYNALLVTLNKEWSFPLRISSVKVTKSAVSLYRYTLTCLNKKLCTWLESWYLEVILFRD